MASDPGPAPTEAVAAQAQSRSGARPLDGTLPEVSFADALTRLDRTYSIGTQAQRMPPEPYERAAEDPVFRPLRIFTIDPSVPKRDGAIALVDVPYEPLAPGPEGRLLRVASEDETQGVRYRRADLEQQGILIRSGYEPSQSDPCFHQQMVYAVCSNVYAAFRKALGRSPGWGPGVDDKLLVLPHACNERNAYYDENRGALRFGYYEAEANPTDGSLPYGFIFTSLSHDIVAHEVTHALLDGLRAHFARPTGPDVLAFHEAFADLVALFQRFSYPEVVRHAMRVTQGRITGAQHLTELALQFGHTTGRKAALRSAIDTNGVKQRPTKVYDPKLEAHELGSVLVAAVFEAFVKVYLRKTERYIRLATGGSGVLPPGELPTDLCDVLSERAATLAGQFLSVCVRAIDYCPPVGLTFGDYLRALITADRDLVPDDRWDYRGAIIDGFRRRGIYPRGVANLAEDALVWRPTRRKLRPIEGLSFARLRFGGAPGSAAGQDELRRQACLLGDYVSRTEHLEEFGLVAIGDPRLGGDEVTLPQVQSIRSSRRIGPDGQHVIDLVAEVTQTRLVRNSKVSFDYHGGSTVILDPRGAVRFVILKSVVGSDRLERRLEYLRQGGGKLWQTRGGVRRPKPGLFRLLHA
jgi:hypothetical protein